MLLVTLLPLVLIPAIVASMLGALYGYQSAIGGERNNLESVATLKEQEIRSWLRERDRDLAVLASEPGIQQQAAALLAFQPAGGEAERRLAYSDLGIRLNDFLDKKVSFAELFVLDAATGQVAISTDVLAEGEKHGDADYFQAGLLASFVGVPEFDARLNVPTLLLSRPIVSGTGKAVGVLVGRVNLGDLSVLMQERVGLGATGETYLVGQDYAPLTQLRAGTAARVETEGTRQAVGQQVSGTGRYANYQGQRVLGVYRWIPELKAALVAEKSEADALRSSMNALRFGLGMVAAVAILGVVVVLAVSRRITRPISRLTEVATQMAGGDLSQRAAVQRTDEIGTLGQAFDRMADQLNESIGTLEQRVADRTRDLEQRAVQLTTVAEVGRAATSMLDPGKLAQQTVDLLRERFDLYYAGLFLVDEAGEYAMLEAGTGEPGRMMKEQGHKLLVGGESMVGAACAERKAHIALDTSASGPGAGVGAEPVRFANPLLPDTRSEMALPLGVGDRVLGALDVQSIRPAAFSDEDIAVMQLAADQVAVAVDNARKFSSEAALLEAASPLFGVSRRLTEVVTTDQAAQAIIDSVAGTEADGCAVARFDLLPDGEVGTITFLGSWSRTGVSRFPIKTPMPASSSMLPVSMMERFWVVADVLEEAQMPASMRQALAQFGARAVVNVPLRVGGRVIGVVIVQRAVPGPFSPVSLRLYETLVEQAAVVLERVRLVEETQRRAAQERLVGEVTARMRQTLNVDAVLDVAVKEIAGVMGLAALDLRLGVASTVRDEGQPGPIVPAPLSPAAEQSGQARAPAASGPARGQGGQKGRGNKGSHDRQGHAAQGRGKK